MINAIISNGNGKYFIATRATGERREVVQIENNGLIAWQVVGSKEAWVPRDQVMGYFAMSEYEFRNTPLVDGENEFDIVETA